MRYPVQLFEIPPDAGVRDQPTELPGFDVTADTVDRARAAVHDALRERGRKVRVVSHLADGGLAAIVYTEAE